MHVCTYVRYVRLYVTHAYVCMSRYVCTLCRLSRRPFIYHNTDSCAVHGETLRPVSVQRAVGTLARTFRQFRVHTHHSISRSQQKCTHNVVRVYGMCGRRGERSIDAPLSNNSRGVFARIATLPHVQFCAKRHARVLTQGQLRTKFA